MPIPAENSAKGFFAILNGPYNPFCKIDSYLRIRASKQTAGL